VRLSQIMRLLPPAAGQLILHRGSDFGESLRETIGHFLPQIALGAFKAHRHVCGS
jgi:hypothetical protein